MFPEEPHFPFQQNTRLKDLDGVYRSIETGHIHVVKNVQLRSYVDDKTGPFRRYTCSIKSTDPEIGTVKQIGLVDVPWEFLLPL